MSGPLVRFGLCVFLSVLGRTEPNRPKIDNREKPKPNRWDVRSAWFLSVRSVLSVWFGFEPCMLNPKDKDLEYKIVN